MSLVRNFQTSTSLPNQIEISWQQPLNFNLDNDEVVVTRSITHYPTELFNSDFPTKATDNRPVEIFRGKTIVGTNIGTISVLGTTLTDTAATFPTSPNLSGRLLRDSAGKVFRILNNTSTTVALDFAPTNGKYVILADFPKTIRAQQNFENNIQTVAGPGTISNLVELVNGNFSLVSFEQDELANMIFRDAAGTKFIVKSNTTNVILFFETDTPLLGVGMTLLSNFTSSQPKPYIDNFKTDVEAAARAGTGLQDNQFYYYTGFSISVGVNVAQAEFSTIDSGISTQASAISMRDRQWGQILYNYWPSLFREMDTTGDLEDLMNVFGFQFGELHSIIDTYNLQNTHTVFATAALALADQTGLPTVGYSIGVDTLRRIGNEMLTAWKLKGSKEGIALFIRILTTWDITNGTGNISDSIIDFLPNITALRFFEQGLGSTNVRITSSDPFVPGGRFVKSLPGIVIPGFFTFREFVIVVPEVALYVGSSTGFSINGPGTNTMEDSSANFGANDSLVGNFLLPNQEETNDILQIVSNTATTITVTGVINNKTPGGNYAVLSPLNTNRFIILNKLFPYYIPFGTKQGFQFT